MSAVFHLLSLRVNLRVGRSVLTWYERQFIKVFVCSFKTFAEPCVWILPSTMQKRSDSSFLLQLSRASLVSSLEIKKQSSLSLPLYTVHAEVKVHTGSNNCCDTVLPFRNTLLILSHINSVWPCFSKVITFIDKTHLKVSFTVPRFFTCSQSISCSFASAEY